MYFSQSQRYVLSNFSQFIFSSCKHLLVFIETLIMVSQYFYYCIGNVEPRKHLTLGLANLPSIGHKA